MLVREATHADIPEIIRMGRLFWSQTPYREIHYCPDSITHACQEMLAQRLLLMGIVNDQIAGAVGAMASPLYANRSVLIGAELFWWVEPQFRNGGIGKLMLAGIEEAAREAGVYRFSMMAFENLELDKAAAVYGRCGYEATERTFNKVL